ncbi:MAG TPA: cation diffusion facilitator family transporter [Caldimonas sp.]|jgi:cobalt-zinc-cadmium efflux system protein|nr:cation diffusion facilitator family transporter [Caldimonas sp.]HEX4235436.1 cation diffusion facilitator family transporter [Caldimonas sp.]
MHRHNDGHAHTHGHSHPHGHAHAHGPVAADAVPSLERAFAIGIAINVAFVVVEAYYGWRADSLALLADAGHNLGDVLGLVLAWAGAFAGRLAPDARHTYGWKRASILAAFANSLLLLVAIGSLAWAAIGRLSAPAPIAAGTVMAVAAIGIVVNGATALLFLRGSHGDLNARGAFIHMAADAAVSAAVVVAAALTVWLGWSWLDPVASLVIACVILLGTWGLFRDSLHLMFDGVPTSINLDAVRAELAALPGVACVSDLHVWATGTTDVALTAHLTMPGGPPGDAFYRAAAGRMHERFAIDHVTLQATSVALMTPCDPAAVAAPAPQPATHAH